MRVRECPQCHARYADQGEICLRDQARLMPPVPAEDDDAMLGRCIGRYRLSALLGKGGMGRVYLAAHEALGRLTAVKVLNAQSGVAHQYFLREAMALARLDDENIVKIYDYGDTEEGEPYIMMEHVAGCSLFQLCHAPHDGTGVADGRLPVGRAIHIVRQVALGLAYAHSRGVTHRDIKPENVLVFRRGEDLDITKLTDFGIARIVDLPRLTGMGGSPPGTLQFLAPEAFTAPQTVGFPADLYAVGILLHDVLIGSPPFEGPAPYLMIVHGQQQPPLLSQRDGDLAQVRGLDALVARLLAKRPEDRPTAAALVDELDEISRNLPPRCSRSQLYARTTLMLPSERLAATLILSSGMEEIDALMHDKGLVAHDLEDLIDEVKADWGSSWPEELAAQWDEYCVAREDKMALEIERARLRHLREERRRAITQERKKVRFQMLSTVELRHQDPRRAAAEREERERALLALDQQEEQLAGDEPDRLLDDIGRAEEAQDQRLLRLVRELSSRSWPSGQEERQRRLVALLGQLSFLVTTAARALGDRGAG